MRASCSCAPEGACATPAASETGVPPPWRQYGAQRVTASSLCGRAASVSGRGGPSIAPTILRPRPRGMSRMAHYSRGMNADELTLRQAAAVLGVTRQTLQERVHSGRMRSRRVPGLHGRLMVLITREEVERWKHARRVGNWLIPLVPPA